MMTEEGILKNGTKFEHIHSFQNDGVTCLLFPFTEDTELYRMDLPHRAISVGVFLDGSPVS